MGRIIFPGFWLCLPGLAMAETVSISSSAATVAQGGSSIFTVLVVPGTNVQSVIVSYQNETGTDQLWTAPYVVTHQFNTTQLNLVVTATVKHQNSDPDTTATTTLNVVGLTITGSAAPTRGWSTTYTVQSSPTGIPLSNVTYTYTTTDTNNNTYIATRLDLNLDGDDKSTWSGVMVVGGTMNVVATAMGVLPGQTKTIGITPRVWTTPITCVEDNEADWGDPPMCNNDELGENRDRDSNAKQYVFVPRSSSIDFSSAMTFSQITSGPSSGWWYVAASTLKCQRETVINKYIKSTGPALGGLTFQQVNSNYECLSGDFVLAVKHHEYRGTPPTPQSIEGHQGRIEYMIQGSPFKDPKAHIEIFMARSSSELRSSVNSAVLQDEDDVFDYGGSDGELTTHGFNWGIDPGSLGYGSNAAWLGESWSTCGCGLENF